MPGIVIPNDRTRNSPPRGYCLSLDCRETSDADRFEFTVENDRFCCPKCGADAPPMVGLLVLTHFLMQDRKGPIIGSGGRRFKLACDANRSYLATITNLEAATGIRELCNCAACLAASVGQDTIQGTTDLPLEPALVRIPVSSDPRD